MAILLIYRDIYAIETIYICVNLLDSSLSSPSYAKIKTRIGSESFATWRFFVSPDGGPNKHGTKMVVHPRVYAHGGSNSIESEQRIALMASRFGRKVRLMGSEQMTEGERERGGTTKVSYRFSDVTDDSIDRADSVGFVD